MVRNSPARWMPEVTSGTKRSMKRPEGVDRHRHRRRIDDRRKEHEGRRAIEQARARPEIGVNARRQRQHRQRKPRHRLDALQRLLEARGIVLAQA